MNSGTGTVERSSPLRVIRYCLSAGRKSLAFEESPFSLYTSACTGDEKLRTYHCQTGNLNAKKSPAATNSSISSAFTHCQGTGSLPGVIRPCSLNLLSRRTLLSVHPLAGGTVAKVGEYLLGISNPLLPNIDSFHQLGCEIRIALAYLNS